MELHAGAGVAIGGTKCDPIISATGLDVGIVAGTCISFDQDAYTGELTINNTMTFAEGDCIEIVQDGCDFTISNKMELHAGPGIAIGGTKCDPVISASGTSVGIAEGDCISFDEDEYTGEVTINSTHALTGVAPIRVTGSLCNRVVSIDPTIGPSITFRPVCGIECKQDNEGEWYLHVKYYTITLPRDLVGSWASECDEIDPYDPYAEYTPEDPPPPA
jgi:hypothetical protein